MKIKNNKRYTKLRYFLQIIYTTDYNLDGILSTENQTERYKSEINRILAPCHSFFQDYDEMKMEREKYASIAWILNCPILIKLLDFYRKILKHI